MSRLALAALLLVSLTAFAQDMPLHTFTKEGEGWVKADGKKPEKDEVEVNSLKGGIRNATFTLGGDRFTLTFHNELAIMPPTKDGSVDWSKLKRPQSADLLAVSLSKDRGTVYVGFSSETAVWAFTPDENNKLVNGAPYAPLRLRKGYDNSKEAREELKIDPPRTAVTALTTDSAGRLYAATPNDVQVFDPTGRLSGALTLPSKGKIEALVWEGEKRDVLAAWIGEQKWTRRTNIK